MNDKTIAKLWNWHNNLQGVLNDIRIAQGLLIKVVNESDDEKVISMKNNLNALIEITNDNLNFCADFMESIKAEKCENQS